MIVSYLNTYSAAKLKCHVNKGLMNNLIISLIVLLSCIKARTENSALLIIDVQNCFVEGGSLAVTGGKALGPIINSIINKYQDNFTTIAYSIDFHPADHISFASQHRGKDEYSTVTLQYDENGTLCEAATLHDQTQVYNCSTRIEIIKQQLWADHCVENTIDSQIIPSLLIPNHSNVIFIKKGTNKNIDSYSAFYSNGNFSQTELNAKLKEANVKKLFVVGIATDYCVKYTALDGKSLGYVVYVVKDATGGVATDSTNESLEIMHNKGVHIISMDELSDKI